MRLFLFDIDGTLMTSGGAGKAAMERALAEVFGFVGEVRDIPFAGRTDRAIGRDLLQLCRTDMTEQAWQRFLTVYFQRLPECLREYPGRVLPGVAELLARLVVQSDTALGLLTGNARRGAEMKLQHYGLWSHFPFGGFGDDHDDRSDVARAALRAANDHLGRRVDPRQTWVIGDTPFDIACARAVGARAVGVATGWHTSAALAAAGPDLLFEDLSNPEPLLAAG
jgi:phosphoglycolate phosphatase-like HAD superfamily hydrolase